MPNWCNNTLFVEGDLNALTDFKKRVLVQSDHNVGGLKFTMEELYPTPKELLEMTSPVMWRGEDNDDDGKKEFEKYVSELTEKYGHCDWYSWRVANWGTKWDVSESDVDEMDGEALMVHYDTAWAPNDSFIKFASTVYPSLKFRLSYEEPGCGFCGVLICKDGEVEIDETADLQWADEYDNMVEWDSEKERWFNIETKEVIDDEDFYPIPYNTFNY